MKEKLLSIIDNDKQFYLILFIIIVLALIIRSFLPAVTMILIYLFMFLMYFKLIRNSIQKANTIFRQVIWLFIAPVIIAMLPFVILEKFFPQLIFNNFIFVPIYIFFFIMTWIIAIFLFDFKKIKVAVQIANAIIISILSITFIFYFTSDFLSELFSNELLLELQKENIGIETILDLFIKTITIPYVLSAVWAGVFIAYKDYKI